MGERTRQRAGDAAFAIFRPGKFMQSKADEKAAAANLRNAERLRAEGMDLAKQLNWEPDYVSDIMPAYQKAQSPVSRAFLESILTGANPSMVSSTRHGADRLRRGAQAGFDQQFGGWEELLARQRAAEQAMPWAPGKFSAPAVMPLGGAYAGPKVSGISSAGAPGWGGVGAETSDEELQALREERLRRMTGV